ncbi:MAG: SDR family NAD(P)-dependent oxidoreductase [Polyangiaceae bacterium]
MCTPARSSSLTGGSSGINLGIAHAFGRLGAKVAINGRKPDKLEAAVGALRERGVRAEGYAADVRDYAALEGAIESAKTALGPIDARSRRRRILSRPSPRCRRTVSRP